MKFYIGMLFVAGVMLTGGVVLAKVAPDVIAKAAYNGLVSDPKSKTFQGLVTGTYAALSDDDKKEVDADTDAKTLQEAFSSNKIPAAMGGELSLEVLPPAFSKLKEKPGDANLTKEAFLELFDGTKKGSFGLQVVKKIGGNPADIMDAAKQKVLASAK